MMGNLASLDTYTDPMTGFPLGGGVQPETPQDPRAFTSDWAWSSAVHPGPYEPQGTMWPDPNAKPPVKRAPAPGDPDYQWAIGSLAAPFHAATQGAGELMATSMLPAGGRLGLATTMALDADPAQGGFRGFPHGIGQFNLRGPIGDLARLNRHVPTKDIVEKSIQPHDIPVGSWLTPLVGDRSRSGELLTHVGEKELRDPVWMQGGYQFVPEWQKQGVAWGSDRAPTSTIAGRVRGFREETPDVYGVYTAMGEKSVDASHHMSDVVSQMLHNQKRGISTTAAEQYDAAMRNIMPDFPGVKSPKLQDFMRGQSMANRNVFVKGMGSSSAMEAGFPDVTQARIAVTHPSLLDVPMYSGGQSIARLTGDVTHGSPGFGLAPHYTYRSKLHGDYVGGFDAPVPKELLWRDFAPKVGARNPSAAGKIWLTGLEGEKMGQLVDPQWQDSIAEYLHRQR